MGVKDLWNILSPLCERKPLYELQGKTVAIDLSGWIVDSQTVVDNAIQPKMYLRNLYFRTVFLLMQGIFPVFVLEGKAPALKHKTIARRNDTRNKFQERKNTRKEGRTRFNRILNECRDLLKYMGITCIQGHGEAEAMCAYLNEDGLVDGCISQDSDCFLYGAKVVYRNFCTSSQGNRGTTGGAVDVYTMEKIKETLNIGRNKMVALALLCGCDYNDGINGVGKEAALKFFKTIDDEHVLERIQEWRNNTSLNKIESELLNPNLCTSCGHYGKLQKHIRSGCVECGTTRKCKDDFREKRTLLLHEISLRKKALYDENFPDQELIEEFLIRKDSILTKLDIEWKQPQINQFIDFMNKRLCWEPQYAFEKIFILTTRWQLLHLPDLTLDRRLSISDLFIPDKIRKIRNIRSVPSYEIIWKQEHSVIEMLRDYKEQSQEGVNNDIDDNSLTSIEPQDLVSKCYPQLIEIFEINKNTKSKKRTAISREKRLVKNVTKNNTEIEDKIKSRQKKTKKKAIETENNRKIDEYVSKNHPISLEESFEKMTITPKRLKHDYHLFKANTLTKNMPESDVMMIKEIKRGPQFKRILETEKINLKLNNTIDRIFNELSPDDFISENEDNDLNMTNIIENICNKRVFQFHIANDEATELKYETINHPIINATEECTKANTFETSISNVEKSVHVEDEKKERLDDSSDEFQNISESYIPIGQRIGENKKLPYI